jgi:hypothetical protein
VAFVGRFDVPVVFDEVVPFGERLAAGPVSALWV